MGNRFRGLLPAILLLCAPLAALSQQAQTRAEGFGKLAPGTRVVLMPADVELFEISAGGVLEPRAEWTEAALRHVKDAYRLRKAEIGLQVTEIEDDTAEPIADLNRLHRAVGGAISSHHFGPWPLPTKEAKLDWSLGPEVAEVRAKTGADYALFTYIRDSYVSDGRKAAIVIGALFGIGISGGVQFAFTSLVDLQSGRVVWASRLLRASGDLRQAEPAQETVDEMLKGLLKEVAPPAPPGPGVRSIRSFE